MKTQDLFNALFRCFCLKKRTTIQNDCDFSYFLNGRIHFNNSASLLIFLALISQCIHYLNYRNNIRPTYLKPFEMMSGLIDPQSVDLTNRAEILRKIKVWNYLFLYCEILIKFVVTSVGFAVSFIPLYVNCSTFQIVGTFFVILRKV